ncbi:MAG: flavin reductase [Phycisphaeraceae bacterium]|nr:MAG: flavin reductase [Phycisphaeraceae bacterium]
MPPQGDTQGGANRGETGGGDPSNVVTGPVDDVLALFPEGFFLITASFEDERSGLRVMSAMRCATEPVLIAVAARKGHAIEPLIRDSHHFALCIARDDDRLLLHKFPPGAEPRGGHDPFDSIPCEHLGSGSPIPLRCRAGLDCEVVRHFDLDADHEIYVGQVRAVKLYE